MFSLKQKKFLYGFTLIEVMIASALVATVTISFLSFAQRGLGLSSRSLRQVQATLLLEEGAEAVKTIRDANWTNISGLTLNNTYYLSYNTSTNVWSLSTTLNDIDGVFTRTVVVDSVNRDSNDDIVASGGTTDTGTKKVTVTVSWYSAEGLNTKVLTLYIADIFS
jgi:prepilin-type N-terminal cleavage/methylation domain-containing protein